MQTLLIPGVGLVKGSGGLLIPGAGRVYLTVAPTITTADLGTITVGTPYSLQLTATGDEPITWSAINLPDGLSLSSTGLLTGTPTTSGAYSATITATNAGGSDADVFAGTVEAAAVAATTGGDDRIDRGHRGYGKRSTLKRKREQEFDAQVRDIYRDLMGDPRTADEAQAIVAAVTEPVRVKGESEAAHEAALMARAEAMRRRADMMDADAMQAEIALRFLHKRLRDMQEDEDVEAVEFLLSQVL